MTAPNVLARICDLATERNLVGAYNLWSQWRIANPNGVAFAGSGAACGNGLFWSESDEVKGMVFLWRPGRVLTALEVKANEKTTQSVLGVPAR